MQVLLRTLAVMALCGTNAEASIGNGQKMEIAISDYSTSEKALQSMMEQTTMVSAVSIVKNLNSTPPALESLIDLYFKESKQGFLQGAKHDVVMNKKSIANAKIMLAGMIQEAQKKLDLEEVRCADYEAAQRDVIGSTRVDIDSYNAVASKARESILHAQQIITMTSTKLPISRDNLAKHETTCLADIGSVQTQLNIITADLEVMAKIVNLSSCSTPTVMLMQCRHLGSDKSFITFGRRVLRKQVGRLNSEFSRKSLNKILTELANSTASLMQISDNEDLFNTSGSPFQSPVSDIPQSKSKQQAKCSFTNNSNCKLVEDKMMTIDAGMKEKEQELKAELARIETECRDTTASMTDEIGSQESQLKSSQTALAESTTELNDAEYQSRIKNNQLTELLHDLDIELRKCRTNIGNFQGEICAVRKIRGELMKLAGENILASNTAIQDCTVTPWSPAPCSSTCGGGTQVFTRTILMPAKNGGATCPPLQYTEQCNTAECPINCQLGTWSGWSTCSALCGGGIRERERTIEVEAQHEGDPCGATSETETCGVASCDRACELSMWTNWATCSKECGGGLQRRVRSIDVPKVADGHCAAADDDERLNIRPCNIAACVIAPNQPTLRCNSALDVVILLDGSGSLRQEGWDASIRATQLLIGAFAAAPEARLSVILFSGPRSYTKAKRCATNLDGLDLEADCGVRVVSHFTSDFTTLNTTVGNLQWPRAFTLTSLALGLASDELMSSRKGVRSAVLVITDGRPMSRLKTGNAAENLRQQTRLMFVPVTRYAPLKDIRLWATRPTRENIIQVPDFNTLQEPATISTLIADICPKVQ